MSEIENILLRDLYKDLPEAPVVERQGLGAMTGRGTVTTQQDTQQRDISPAQSSVAEYMKKIIQKQIQDGASISAAAQDVPFDPAIDNMETLSARGYDSDDVLRSSVATGAVSATKQKNVRRDVMEQAERMIQEMQQERTPVRKQAIQDYLTGVDIEKAQGNLEDSVLETISGILGVPVPPKEDDSVTIEDAPDADVVLDEPTPVKTEGLGSRPVAEEEPLTDDDMGLPDKPSQVESLKDLYASKGKAYKDSKIKKHSHVKEPIIEGGIRGNSRIGGDASIETQTKVINKIVQMGRNENMSEEDIGFMLAMARIESGFNPDAAAGTTSASGIGQFIDATGETYGLTDANRWDLESQVDALIGYTKFNKEKVIADNRDQKDLYKWMYKYHHDGPNSTKSTSKSLGWKIATKKVNPLVNKYTDYVKSLDPLQGPELPEESSLSSIRPSARPEPNLQVASN